MIENKILKWALILGIVIVLNLFFAYALKVIYKAPVWDDFCKQEQVIEKIETQEVCLAKGGQWDKNIYPRDPNMMEKPIPTEIENGYCNLQFTCSNDYQNTLENYEKNVFMTLVALGVISIIVGFFVVNFEVVAMGLSLGGVLSFIVASIRYWQYASEYLQVVILGIALVALIWLGIKKFK